MTRRDNPRSRLRKPSARFLLAAAVTAAASALTWPASAAAGAPTTAEDRATGTEDASAALHADLAGRHAAGAEALYSRVRQVDVAAVNLWGRYSFDKGFSATLHVPFAMSATRFGSFAGSGNVSMGGSWRYVALREHPGRSFVGLESAVGVPSAMSEASLAAPVILAVDPARFLPGATTLRAGAMAHHERGGTFVRAELGGELVLTSDAADRVAPLFHVAGVAGARLTPWLWAVGRWSTGNVPVEPDLPGVELAHAVDLGLVATWSHAQGGLTARIPVGDLARQYAELVGGCSVAVQF